MGQEALDAETVRQFAEATERSLLLQERVFGMSPVSGVSNATIAVNAGGMGVWIATTACLVMLGMMVVGAFWLSSEFDRINSRFNDQTDTDSVQDAYIHKLRAEQQQERK